MTNLSAPVAKRTLVVLLRHTTELEIPYDAGCRDMRADGPLSVCERRS